MAPITAMAATEATAKFNIASLLCPNIRDTIPPSQGGSFFDCRRLSTTILKGQGSMTSVNVSASTATSAIVRAFQCGRRRCPILNLPEDLPEDLDDEGLVELFGMVSRV